MCFSAPASFTALIISIGISLWLWNRNHTYDRWNALFILSFALIQLWEGLLWMGFDSNILTSLIVITLLSQPVAQSYGGWMTTKSKELEYLFYFYVLVLLYGIIMISQSNYASKVGINGHLVWENKSNSSGVFSGVLGFIYLIGLFLPLLWF